MQSPHGVRGQSPGPGSQGEASETERRFALLQP